MMSLLISLVVNKTSSESLTTNALGQRSVNVFDGVMEKEEAFIKQFHVSA
jgi:hypothetical protein